MLKSALLKAPISGIRRIVFSRSGYLDKRKSWHHLMTTNKELRKPLVWIDCEMTGLDHTRDQIIEICCLITDGDLNLIDPIGYESVVHCPKEILDGMDEWCTEHHGASGLTKRVLECNKDSKQVEKELLEYLRRNIPKERVGVLAGNSVHMDRLFMLKDFPAVINHLFYRIVDVSSISEVLVRHNPKLATLLPRKKASHTARADILESIAQLKWYREHYLKSPEETEKYFKTDTDSRDFKAESTRARMESDIEEDYDEVISKRPKMSNPQ